MASPTARRWTAFIGSFGVYLIPLVGPHAFYLVGEALVSEIGSDRSRTWVATDFGVALLAQLAVWLVLRWSLEGPSVRKLTWLLAFPLAMGLNVAYLAAIPAYFLIEPDTAGETNALDEHCFVRGVSLMSIRTGVNQPVDGATAWWTQKPDSRYALLRLPDCSVTDAVLPTPTLQPGGHVDFLIGLQFASPDGPAIVERTETGPGLRTWFGLFEPGGPLEPLVPPGEVEGPPIVSRSGDAVAWMQRVAGSGPPVLERVLVRRATTNSQIAEVDVELGPLGAASYVLMDVDATARELTLWRNEQPIVLGFDGRERPLSFDRGAMRPQSSTYLRVKDGWVAWDAYRDEGPYQVAWSLGSRSGTHRTNAGRSVTSAAVNPTGSLIAISETTTLSIGNARDVVYIVRTDTGAEVFRKYLPRYARSPVVFFSGGLFGYSDLEGTHVLTTPSYPRPGL